MQYEWLAIVAASLWALSSILSITPARHLGTFAYSRWRMGCVTVILGSAALVTGGWSTLGSQDLLPMILSGFIGIFIGDTALFSCLNRLGPRRAGLLFSCHAVFSALLGYWLFAETLTGWRFLGAAMVFSGVMIAVFYGSRKDSHQWEEVRGSIYIAVGLGLLAAFCQAVGGVLAKPVMVTEVDAIAASAVRMATAFTAHFLLLLSGIRIAKAYRPINLQVFGMTAINAFLAMGIGMTLILYALKYGDVGMVAILSSMSPVLVLPLLWLFTRQNPAWTSWLGACIAATGTVLILSQ